MTNCEKNRSPDATDKLVGFGDDNVSVGDFDSSDERYADFSNEDIEIIRKVWRHTVTSPERIYALIRSIEYIVQNQIEGDIVECGVWRGGSMMAAAHSLKKSGCTNRRIWMFDTFAGMTRPESVDIRFDGVEAIHEYLQRQVNEYASTWAAAGLEEVESKNSSKELSRTHFQRTRRRRSRSSAWTRIGTRRQNTS